MISKTEKRGIIIKVVIVLLVTLVVLSILRVLILHSELIDGDFLYIAMAKEILFSLLSASFVATVLYMMIKGEFSSVHTKISDFAFKDALTGLYNRHYLNNFFEEFTALTQDNTSYAVVFIDIDHFKKVNDTYGHGAGDCVLKSLALELKSFIRSEDILCRYGGEEFVMIFNKITKTTVLEKLELIREKVQSKAFNCDKGDITISIGFSLGSQKDKIMQILLEADSALYMAKNAGRNCVKVFPK